MRKIYFYLIVITILVICLPYCKKNASQPNIVLIVLDTLRADHMPLYGYAKNTSPFISKIAGQSIIFENAFSASSWTAPATASIFTSLYPFQHGVIRGFVASHFYNYAYKVKINQIPDKLKTITEVLKENGYFTCGISSNINIGDEMGFTQGFDKFKLFKHKDEKKMNPQLKKWAKEIRSKQKYFMYIHYNDCHSPYHKRLPWYKKMPNPRDDTISRYDSEINYVDSKIKEMFNYFNWDKNTLLIITSDHGEEFWEHNRTGHGYSLYSEVIKIPLLIYFPEKGRIHKRLNMNVSNIDILPTIRNYLKISDDGIDEGQNLLPLIFGEDNQTSDKFIFSHLSRLKKKGFDSTSRIHRCTIFKEWKSIFIRNYKKDTTKKLFNLKNDPGERSNIFETNIKIAQLLRSKFINFEKRCKKFKQKKDEIRLDKDKMDELKTLGYIH